MDIGRGYKGNVIEGQEIVSHVRAEVVESYGGAVGNYVILKVECPSEFPPHETVTRYYHYYHLQNGSNLQAGDIIEPGTVIGNVGNSGAKSAGAHLHFEVQTSYIPQGENFDNKLNTTGREAYTINPSAHLNAEYTHGTVTKDVYPSYNMNYDTEGEPPADWAPPDGANWPEVENVPGGTLAPWDCVEYDPEREQQLVKNPQAMIQV